MPCRNSGSHRVGRRVQILKRRARHCSRRVWGRHVRTDYDRRLSLFGCLWVVPLEDSFRATHRGSGHTVHSSCSSSSTRSVPYAGDACAGDVANVCKRVESGGYDRGSAEGQSDRVFGRDRGRHTCAREARRWKRRTSNGKCRVRRVSDALSRWCNARRLLSHPRVPEIGRTAERSNCGVMRSRS